MVVDVVAQEVTVKVDIVVVMLVKARRVPLPASSTHLSAVASEEAEALLLLNRCNVEIYESKLIVRLMSVHVREYDYGRASKGMMRQNMEKR